MSNSCGLAAFWRESTHLPFLYLTRTLTTPVQRPQLQQTRQPASYPKRCPYSSFSQDEYESSLRQLIRRPGAPITGSTIQSSKGTGCTAMKGDGNTQPKDNPSSQESQEITNIFSSVMDTMSQISNPKYRVKTQQPLDLFRAGTRSVNDKLRNFQFTNIDPSSPHETKFAGVDLSVAAFAVAQKETRRICKEIDDAVADGRGDLGIWKICEEMIFPMLKQADLDDALPVRPAVKSSTDMFEDDDVSAGLDKGNNARCKQMDIHPDVPAVIVVGHVYPATLLHALRLLQNKFPMSPITTRLFESIRSHGRASFIVGSSKELFHELIDFRWRVYNDLPFIVALLKEMEENGVDFDKRTLELVEKIRQRGAREISKARYADGRARGSNIKIRSRRAGGGTSNSGTWWDSPVIQKSYRELTSWAKGMDAQIRDVKELEEKAQKIWSNKHQEWVYGDNRELS
ncbi:uncharacterized protein GIQ15_00021 [Arthroderma uncinatum]|uniref:uncharacterized protein n=1 Tax=Arthroderma uncinatum TaxID=74035 RepID=UPI00144A5BC7|nr:uncharacterized protein GIQ15_00021 [Arthroderma uncinatum]KAF3490504.1 hypothetical protein GIQ15_00021 [Arthroderma uncinatum]